MLVLRLNTRDVGRLLVLLLLLVEIVVDVIGGICLVLQLLAAIVDIPLFRCGELPGGAKSEWSEIARSEGGDAGGDE